MEETTPIEESSSIEQAPAPQPVRRKQPLSLAWRIAFIIALLLLLALAALSYYLYSQLQSANSKNASLSSNTDTLTKELTSTKSKLSAAQSQLASLQAPSSQPAAAPTQSDLTLSISSAQYVNPAGTVTQGGTWLGIRLTLTNPTSSPIAVSAQNFTIKDSNGNTYQQTGFTNATSLPSGWGVNTLQAQTIPAHQSVAGNLIFQTGSKNLSGISLLNGTVSYPVTVSTAQ